MFGISFSVHQFLTTWFDYIAAAGAVAIGIYLAAIFDMPPTNPIAWILRPLRYVGYALVIGGVAYGYGTHRESIGAAKCQAAWAQKNLEQQLADAQRDLGAAKLAAKFRAEEAKQLAAQKQEADGKIADYENSVQALSSAVAVCRRATPDDDRRMRDILGYSTKAGRHSP